MCNARQGNWFPQDRIFFHQTLGLTHRTREGPLRHIRHRESPAAAAKPSTAVLAGKKVRYYAQVPVLKW